MRTFSDIRDEVMALMDEVGEENLTKTNVDNAINRAHEMRCAMHPWHFMLWPVEEQFTTIHDQLEYALHPQYHKPLWFWNSSRKFPLREVPFRSIPNLGLQFQQEASGSAGEFSMIGRGPVARQPVSGGSLITLTAGAATTGTVQIQGDTTVGFITETLTLTAGTSITSTGVFKTITRISKTSEWTQTIALTDSEGNVILALGASEYGKTYPLMMLYGKPPSGEVIKYRFYRAPVVMVNDYDAPDIPYPYDGILTYDTLLLMTGYNAKVSPVAVQEWTRMRLELERQLYDFDAEHALHGYAQYVNVDPYGS